MTAWLIFGIFLIVGLGTCIAGIVFMRAEKEEAGGDHVYRNMSIFGAVLTVGTLLAKIVL